MSKCCIPCAQHGETTVPKYSGEAEKSQMKQMLISLLFADRYYKIYIRIAWNLIAQRLERMRGIFGNADKEGRRNEEMQKRNQSGYCKTENGL